MIGLSHLIAELTDLLVGFANFKIELADSSNAFTDLTYFRIELITHMVESYVLLTQLTHFIIYMQYFVIELTDFNDFMMELTNPMTE